MNSYQTAILDAMGITRHQYLDPSVSAFETQPMLSDLQAAMPNIRFEVSELIALKQDVLALPATPTAQQKRAIWLAYCQHTHEQ